MRHVALVIDGDTDARIAIAADLRRAGLLIAETAGRDAALRRLGAVVPNVIVLELGARKEDDAELIAWLRSDERLANVPVVAVAAGAAGRAPPPGVSVLVERPHERTELVRAVRSALRAGEDEELPSTD